MYTITQRGQFSVWYLPCIEKEYTKKFEKETHSIIVMKESPKIVVAFEQEVMILNSDDESYQMIGERLLLE